MKKLVYSLFFFTLFINSQELSSLFDNRTFELQHFIENGEVRELDLSQVAGETAKGIPSIYFSFTNNELDVDIFGYCNSTIAKYKLHEDHLEVLLRGGTTLLECGSGEETDYFQHLTGTLNWQQPSGNINFQFSNYEKTLTFWIHENHKLVFEEKALSVKDYNLERLVSIYPNPSSKMLNIKISDNFHSLSKLTIIDGQGRIIATKSEDLDVLNIFNLSNGIYFLKVETKDNLSVVKRFIKM